MGKLFALFTNTVATTNLQTEEIGEVASAVTAVIGNPGLTENVGILSELKEYFTLPFLLEILNVVIALFLFYVLYKIICKYSKKIGRQKLKPQTAMMLDKGIKYTFQILVVVYVLGQFGINLNALLGAAGIAGIAIGFAAQTSVSNIISGFFVLWERALQIGDNITIDDVTGTVQSIDLLSVRIVTPDNQMIRIPNETIINSKLINATYFPVRRLTVRVSVSYNSDMEKVMEVLKKVPDMCPTVIKEPAPVVFYDGFESSRIAIVLGVWFNKADFLATKNAVYLGIKKAFDEAEIEIPFEQIVVRTVQEDE